MPLQYGSILDWYSISVSSDGVWLLGWSSSKKCSVLCEMRLDFKELRIAFEIDIEASSIVELWNEAEVCQGDVFAVTTASAVLADELVEGIKTKGYPVS